MLFTIKVMSIRPTMIKRYLFFEMADSDSFMVRSLVLRLPSSFGSSFTISLQKIKRRMPRTAITTPREMTMLLQPARVLPPAARKLGNTMLNAIEQIMTMAPLMEMALI